MILIAAVLTIVMPAQLAFAVSDFEVQNSNVVVHPQGQTLQKGTQVKLPEGGRLVLIDRTGQLVQTRVCVGRYEGVIESCPAAEVGCAWWRKIFATCDATESNDMAEGATRHVQNPRQ